MQRGEFVKVVTDELGTIYGRIHSVVYLTMLDKDGKEKLSEKPNFVNIHYIDSNLELAKVTVLPDAVKAVAVVK